MNAFDKILAFFFPYRPTSSAHKIEARALALAKLAGGGKKSITPAETAPFGIGGTPRFSDFRYTTSIRSGYKKSVWLYRCVTLIATLSATIPWKVRRQIDPVNNIWEDAPDSELALLIKTPNEQWSWPAFIEYQSLYRLLGGETFITKIRTDVNLDPSATVQGKGIPIALWAHDTEKFDPIPGNVGEPFVKGYRLRGRLSQTVLPEDMIHVLNPDPEDQYRGMSPMKVGDRAVKSEVSAQDWQIHSFENNAVPAGILTIPGDHNSKQWKSTVELFAARYAGAKNARKLMVWSDKVTFAQMASTAVEADYRGTREMNRVEICGLYGIPPMMVGILDFSTLANFQTGELVLWTHCILPHLIKLRDEFNRHLAPEFEEVDGGPMMLELDISRVAALVKLFEQRLELALKMVERGVPWSVVIERFDLGVLEFPGWDLATVAGGRALLQDVGKTAPAA